MSIYISKGNGRKASTIFNNLALDQTSICGLESLYDPTHLRTIRKPDKSCICVFNYVSRIVSLMQGNGNHNTTFFIADVREEEIE